MNVVLAIVGSVAFIGAAASMGRWMKLNEDGRSKMVVQMHVFGFVNALIGIMMLLSKPVPGTTTVEFGIVTGTGITTLLIGVICSVLAGYGSKPSRN